MLPSWIANVFSVIATAVVAALFLKYSHKKCICEVLNRCVDHPAGFLIHFGKIINNLIPYFIIW